MLKLLNDLDPVQIIILQTYSSRFTHFDFSLPQRSDAVSYDERQQELKDFRERHSEVFRDEIIPKRERPVYEHDGKDPQNEAEQIQRKQDWQDYLRRVEEVTDANEIAREKRALYLSRVHHLAEMGLIGDSQQRIHSGLEDPIITTLTPLGAALLKIIQVADSKEWGKGEQLNAVQSRQKGKEDLKQFANEQQNQWRLR